MSSHIHSGASPSIAADGDAREGVAVMAAVRDPMLMHAAAGAVVAALAALIFFFHLGTYGLWEPDEARYAEIAREMLATHHFLVPHLDYVPYIEKPPLLYWLTALSMAVFGVNEFAARLVNAAAALAGVIATYLFAWRTFDRGRAMLAAAVLATSGLYAVMAQVLTTDMLLTSATTVALFAFFLHWRDGGRWCWLAYVAMGLGVMAKGPIGIAIPILAALIFLWSRCELANVVNRFHVIGGFLLTAAICLPWFVAITLREPGFFDFYFIGEHFRRFFESSYSHGQPIYYYVAVIAGGLLPWTIFAPFLPWRSLAPNPARRFCAIAAAVVVIFFSIASAKLIPYMLPMFPPLAVIIADAILRFADHPGPDIRRLAPIGPLLGCAGAGVIAVALNAYRFASPYPMMVRPALYMAGTIVVVVGMLSFILFWQRRLAAGIFVTVAAATAILLVASYGRILAEPARSYAQLARAIAARAPGATLVCYPRYLQSLPFYARRRVILVGPRTELDYGARHSPDGSNFFFTRRADLLRLWNQPQRTVLIVDRWALPSLGKDLGRYSVIASDSKKLAVIPVRNRTDAKVDGD